VEQIRSRVAAHRDVIDLGASDSRVLEALCNRERWKPGPVFDAAKSLFLECDDELTVAQENSGYVAVKGVDAQDIHLVSIAQADAVLRGARVNTDRSTHWTTSCWNRLPNTFPIVLSICNMFIANQIRRAVVATLWPARSTTVGVA
jgi:hypothetical protein